MELAVERSPISGLLVLRLPVHHDARGWFKENWQRARMTALGLPDFGPVQHNVSYNAVRGVTRGIHAEPWDKLVSVVAGRAFGAWVDLRDGASFGTSFHHELGPDTAVFVPRGVGNSFQTLEDGTVYSYLVNEHFRPGDSYPALRLDDPTAAVPWPIPLHEAEVSDRDRTHPALTDLTPMPRRRTLLLGSEGQLGRALAEEFRDAHHVARDALDVTDDRALAAWPWGDYEVVLNATGYTAVDEAETDEGRRTAWTVNAEAPGHLARLARVHGFTLVHYSSDYVFDGTKAEHAEDEPPSPLGVYGQTKAAGDLAVQAAPRHYLVRTSWAVGDGRNFVRTMTEMARAGACPQVVDDQVGRLTFTHDLARATRHLLEHEAAYGTYNCTSAGEPMSWADVARAVFRHCGRDEADVTPVSTEEYAAGRRTAPRPAHSALRLEKLAATGFVPMDAGDALTDHLTRQEEEQ